MTRAVERRPGGDERVDLPLRVAVLAEDLPRVLAEERRAAAHAAACAEALSAARRKAAPAFARAIEAHLADLGMHAAEVEIEVVETSL
ncbi:MAG: hypothetical protein ACJ79R_02155, partial [Anaeromyxobacteraceae bacterium]